jgi:hypothetical protein
MSVDMIVKFTGLFLLMFVVSCATARLEEVEPGQGGVITLTPPQNPEAKEKARMIMEENCQGKKPMIVKEGFVVVGTTTSGQEETSPGSRTDLFTGKKTASISTSSSSTTNQVKEWRLTYKCQ